MAVSDIGWLCRPIAHRGFHDNDRGIIENSSSAITAAISRGYAIEVDLQASADNQPVVFHDKKLGRLTSEHGRVNKRPLAELLTIKYANSSDTILGLNDLLSLVDGRVPLLIEIKGKKNNAGEFGFRVGEILRNYKGPLAVMSFNPHLVASCIEAAPDLPRGLTISYFGMTFSGLTRFLAMYLRIGRLIRPQFIAYDVRTVPGMTSFIMRKLFGMKLLVWTVRTDKQVEKAQHWADAMIFEGFEV